MTPGRPLIAVTGVPIATGKVAGWPRHAAVAVPAPYLEALERAGADGAVLMPSVVEGAEAARRLSRFDGLLVVGGGDVDPARYDEEPRPEVFAVSAARDGFELPLLEAAAEGRVPTLAICRGAQVLNVALGGSLHQHIDDDPGLLAHRSADGGDGVLHDVGIHPGSRLAKAMGAEQARVFSHHHQALARLGRGLVPVAWAGDGLTEAVELEDGWMVGIQWHAEATAATDPAQQRLFEAFVREVKG